MIEFYAAAFVAGAALVAFARWALIPRDTLPRHRVRVMRLRVRLHLHPGRGHATVAELWLRWGRLASWRRARHSRPGLSWRRRFRASEHSISLGRAHYGHQLRLPVEEHALVMAPPRTGKTGYLAAVILHYPGPVVSTTTKPDVFSLTSGVRAGIGPVLVFNPQNIGAVPSTFRWNPVAGCEDQATAIRRADAFAGSVSLEGAEDASFWSSKASSYLRGLFHAAALVGGDMRLVTRWALGDAEDAEQVLASKGAPQWALELGELRGEAQKTAATVRMVLSRALGFMTDPALAASVTPAPGDVLDIEAFLAQRGTLYMIADSQSEASPVAPLFAAMANEIHHTAAQVASRSRGSRLDPPLLMALDEVTQICPVPLPVWAADSGGKGIQLLSVAHGEAQLASRWKDHGRQVILDTAGARVFLPGIADVRTLEMASKLCGQVALREHGAESHSRHDVLTPDMIRRLPAGRALVLRGGYAPVITRLPAAWKDRTYKRARRAGTAVAAITPAPAPVAVSAAQETPETVWRDVPAVGPAPGQTAADVFEPLLVPDDAESVTYPWSAR
ncbi:MAG: type IV secretory system conjugative DNA transfer family protein [Streptosporangiaceae bacterium]